MRREYGNVPIAREISDALRAKIACACGNLGPPNTLTKGCVCCQNSSQILAMSQSSDALLDHIADYL
jgi:G3E family GTPase